MLKLSKLALAIALGTTSSLSQASEIDDLQKQLQLLKQQMQQLQSKLDAAEEKSQQQAEKQAQIDAQVAKQQKQLEQQTAAVEAPKTETAPKIETKSEL